MKLFISCPFGLEDLLCKELVMLGITQIHKHFCGVEIPYTEEHLFTANYQSRIATRVLLPLLRFSCHNKDDLYRHAREIPWQDFLTPEKTFAIDANLHQHPNITHSLFAALVVKDAICDRLREKQGKRPSVDVRSPDLQFNLFLHKTKATLYLDTSGSPLFKRGWRKETGPAPLQESLAAACLLYCGYTQDHTFVDPFAGSGTFLLEAALIATKTAPGFLRKRWGFFHLPHFAHDRWLAWKTKQDQQRIPLVKGRLFGSDKSREAIDICKRHLIDLHFDPFIELSCQDISSYRPRLFCDLCVTNPPYGKRLAYQNLETEMQAFASSVSRMYYLSPSTSHQRGLLSLHNGGIDIQLFLLKPSSL